jgi:peptide/nickel transport system permease protein
MSSLPQSFPIPSPHGQIPHRSWLWTRLHRLPRSAQAAGIMGAVLILTLATMAIFAPILSPHDPTERVGLPFGAPNAQHPLGTNDIGQDILSELIYGSRVSLTVGIMAASLSTLIGTAIGLLSGYYRRLERWLMRLTDVVLVLPFLPLLILLAAYVGRSLWSTIVIIALLTWAGTARLIRSQVLGLSQREYVLAAHMLGCGSWRVMSRHIWPHVIFLVVSEFLRASTTAILLEVSLSFLGLGDPLQKSWGTTLYWAQVRGAFLTPAWAWWVLPPGLFIGAVAFGFALLAFAFEQIINPRLR